MLLCPKALLYFNITFQYGLSHTPPLTIDRTDELPPLVVIHYSLRHIKTQNMY